MSWDEAGHVRVNGSGTFGKCLFGEFEETTAAFLLQRIDMGAFARLIYKSPHWGQIDAGRSAERLAGGFIVR